MKETDSLLSIKELEMLCNFYLECKLSSFEEKELEYILLNSTVETPLIQDVKKIMGFEEMERHKDEPTSKSKKRSGFYLKKIPWVAAVSACLIISCCLVYRFNNIDENPGMKYCQVYSEGRLVNQDEALRIANSNLERMKTFEEKIKTIEIQEEEKVNNFKTKTGSVL